MNAILPQRTGRLCAMAAALARGASRRLRGVRAFGAGGGGPSFKSTGEALGAMGGIASPTTFQHALGKALRETGVALDRAGRAFGGDLGFHDHTSKHTTLVALEDKQPSVAADACVAESATLYGDATVASLATVGHGSVVYGPAAVHGGATVGCGAVVKADVRGTVLDGAVVLDAVPAGETWAGAPAAKV